MLSWANESLIVDGLSQSDIRQGVTLEVMGEGESMGPLNERMKAENVALQGDINTPSNGRLWTNTCVTSRIAVCQRTWRRLLARPRSGATRWATDRAPTPEEMARMKVLVRQAMEEGALGDRILAYLRSGVLREHRRAHRVVPRTGQYGGMYISHIRSEGNALLEGVDELVRIAREAGVAAEIFHLKAAGAANWPNWMK